MPTHGTSGEGRQEWPIFEGSRRQVRNDHGPVSGEPANARLTAEAKPLRGHKTSLPAYSHGVFASLVSNSTSRKMTSLYLSPGLRMALMRSTTADSTSNEASHRLRCMGHRAAPLGSLEAMAS